MKRPFSRTRCAAAKQDKYGTIVQPFENEKKRKAEREKRELDEACRQIYKAVFGEEYRPGGRKDDGKKDADGQSG